MGAADSIADIVGAAVGWDLLGVDRVVASPVPTGSGRIKIAHGECSIPAPATAELLRGIPLAASNVEGELTTPTGAAILAAVADSFGPLPPMKIEQIGYGAGQKDFPGRPNILRLLVGEAIEEPAGNEAEQVCVLETNLDDLSGELIGYCISRLWEAGALDVYTTPIQMKKNRPAVMLTVLCRPGDAAAMEDVLFTETTTLGVRSWTGRAARFASPAAHGHNALGPDRRQARLARRRRAPFCPRVRVLPPRSDGPSRAASGKCTKRHRGRLTRSGVGSA